MDAHGITFMETNGELQLAVTIVLQAAGPRQAARGASTPVSDQRSTGISTAKCRIAWKLRPVRIKVRSNFPSGRGSAW